MTGGGATGAVGRWGDRRRGYRGRGGKWGGEVTGGGATGAVGGRGDGRRGYRGRGEVG